MPVASTVQAPELFKGTLKDYQLKGLQWLVNCYEQVSCYLRKVCLFLLNLSGIYSWLTYNVQLYPSGFKWHSC